MLEKTEGQSKMCNRDTFNTGLKTQNKEKTK